MGSPRGEAARLGAAASVAMSCYVRSEGEKVQRSGCCVHEEEARKIQVESVALPMAGSCYIVVGHKASWQGSPPRSMRFMGNSYDVVPQDHQYTVPGAANPHEEVASANITCEDGTVISAEVGVTQV